MHLIYTNSTPERQQRSYKNLKSNCAFSNVLQYNTYYPTHYIFINTYYCPSCTHSN